MPCFHCPSTSIQENKWNSKSCPEGLPLRKNGTMTANAAAMMMSTGNRKSGLASGESRESALALPAGLACEGSRFNLLLPVEFILSKQSDREDTAKLSRVGAAPQINIRCAQDASPQCWLAW